MSDSKPSSVEELKGEDKPTKSRSDELFEVGEWLSSLDSYERDYVKKVCDMLVAKDWV